MVHVKEVARRSRAARAGILPGDVLVSVNGNEIEDVLDYRFYLADESVTLSLARNGEPYDVTIEKEEYDDIGLGFETPLMDKKQSCRNKCVFCFIDQLPSGMRDSLYFKDDDARLSFLHGNYITLTNLTDRDVDRVLNMHFSPINVSVHTTNPDLRVTMMKNPHAGEALHHLHRLAEGGIELHCQIVLCRGLNDGNELDRTMHDLAALYPAVSSVSVVPAGLTRHREGLYPLEPFTKEESIAVLDQVEAFASAHFEAYGSRLFFCSDEFYLAADRELPNEEFYEGYPQIENGVGMLTSLYTEFISWQNEIKGKKLLFPRHVSIATGVSAYPMISKIARQMERRFPGLSVTVYEIKNRFFGESITVAGLLTATDIIDQLRGKDLGHVLILPADVLRSEGDLFLDDKTPADVERTLGTSVRFAKNDGASLAAAILRRSPRGRKE
ncbi:MAG: DUF512 domain-containing protein [Clostridia bacterium]|nr:DUF512 domain-containing protein [Clostridia bacterium]